MRVVALGRIHFWNGGSLWIGHSKSPTAEHSHHAVQVSLALNGHVRIRPRNDTGWLEELAIVVPSDVPHAFDGMADVVATIFCDPESKVGRALSTRFGASRVTAVPSTEAHAHTRTLAAAYRSAGDDDSLSETCRRILHDLAGVDPSGRPADRRIANAAAAVGTRLEGPIRLADIARCVNLSPSRFRHLFAAQTGIPFRQYVLWRRLQRALEIRMAGGSWAEAAHAASFADSAHLTRTFQRMLGFAPSAFSVTHEEETARSSTVSGQ
jgi:AraC family transcriptional regulator